MNPYPLVQVLMIPYPLGHVFVNPYPHTFQSIWNYKSFSMGFYQYICLHFKFHYQNQNHCNY